MAIMLRDGSVTEDPRLGRVYEHDPRSLGSFGFAAVVTDQQQDKLRSFQWSVPDPAPLNQDDEPECVGFSFTHDAIARPVSVRGLTKPYARGVYRHAQDLDSLPNTNPGTSVLAGAKAMTARGFYLGYRWCATEEELALAVGYKGPVIVGTDWFQGMNRPDRNGFLTPSGRMLGGHAWLIVGISIRGGYYHMLNSWGPQFGTNGRAKVARSVMRDLWTRRADGCVPIRTTKTTVSP